MVGEAVAAFKGEFAHTAKDTKVELPLNAHIPVEYIDSERLRLEAYSKISASKNADELESVHSELEDRYGAPPAEVERLFHVARFRLDASEAEIDEVQVQGKMIRFAHVDVWTACSSSSAGCIRERCSSLPFARFSSRIRALSVSVVFSSPTRPCSSSAAA